MRERWEEKETGEGDEEKGIKEEGRKFTADIK